jgi:glycosyltransferase involved in cell wall biosynthesis
VVGIMRPGKGHAAVLEVARQLAFQRGPGRPSVRFLLAGDGPLRRELQARAYSSGTADAVRFLGYRDDIPALLQASDLLVHASDFDALPTALIEGLAAGLPAVAYAVGGVPEILTSESGCLVPAGDVLALTAAVQELACDAERRVELGEHARKRFANEFEATAWAERLRILYADVPGQRRQR